MGIMLRAARNRRSIGKKDMNRKTVCHWAFTSLLMMAAAVSLLMLALAANAQEPKAKIRISNATSVGFSGLPLIAARDWGLFTENGFDVQVIIVTTSVAAPALSSGDIDYISGVGPATVSATLSGLPSRAVWFSSDKIAYWLMSRPQFKGLKDLKSRKIGLTGLGGATHVSLLMAMEKLGVNPSDFTFVSLPSNQLLRSLESGFIDAASLNPPFMFFARRQGFNKLVDIGQLVEFPAGGLTTLIKTIKSRPDEVKKVIRSLQLAKEMIRRSKEKAQDLIMNNLKVDRETAAETYDLFLTTLSENGMPSHTGMENIIRAIKSQGRFTDRKITFEDIADDTLARGVAKELGYKTR
jgi:ABC-type nitrate/sulfonate/bicarbonate transport system substrate-binding protein